MVEARYYVNDVIRDTKAPRKFVYRSFSFINLVIITNCTCKLITLPVPALYGVLLTPVLQ